MKRIRRKLHGSEISKRKKCRSKNRKRSLHKKKFVTGTRTSLTVLPDELILNIMANVSSGSLTDFFNLKLCCSDFRSLAEEKYIYRHVSLERLPFLNWKSISMFMKKCIESNNPEALYREGVVKYFSQGKYENGLKYLRGATNEGHLEACYVLAMIFIFNAGRSEEQVMQLGLGLLGRVCEAKKEIECREKLKSAVGNFWPNLDYSWFIQTKPDDRCTKHRKEIHEWSMEYSYFEDANCIPCRCDAEINRFNNTFDWRRYPFYGSPIVIHLGLV